jgi:predicted nucleic acid-binding protein
MARIFWDTNLFIYLIEQNPQFGVAVLNMYRRMKQRGDALLTSALTLGEVLTKPLQSGDLALADRYRRLLEHPSIQVINFDVRAAEFYAQIRLDKTIRPPDAIQLSCAARASVDLFITNDDRLSRKVIPGISFITAFTSAPL